MNGWSASGSGEIRNNGLGGKDPGSWRLVTVVAKTYRVVKLYEEEEYGVQGTIYLVCLWQ